MVRTPPAAALLCRGSELADSSPAAVTLVISLAAVLPRECGGRGPCWTLLPTTDPANCGVFFQARMSASPPAPRRGPHDGTQALVSKRRDQWAFNCPAA